MFCPKCGNDVSDSSDFCPKCGTKIERESVNPVGNLIITTGCKLDGYNIDEYLGVFSEDIFVGYGFVNYILISLWQFITMFTGKENTRLYKRVMECKNLLLGKIAVYAQSIGANAVVGMKFEQVSVMFQFQIRISGTYVKADKI